jgi:hypothetical protein
MSQEPKDGDFVVIDKRAASTAAEESGPRTDAVGPEETPRADDPKSTTSPPQEPASDGSRDHASPAQADFAMLVQPFFVAALFHMGLAADPETGQPGPRNLPLARHNIDILEVIADKTRGNLDDPEQQLLEGVLYELRMSFVKVGRISSE